MDYTKADSMLQGRNHSSRKIGNNTYLIRHDSFIAIKLHNTEIIKYYPDNRIILDTEGWTTVTTKARMNEYLDKVSIWQERSVWYISNRGEWTKRTAYYDGMEIKPDGTLEPDPDYVDTKQLKKDIRKFTDGYITALFAGEVSAPSNGDCWYCLFRENAGNIKTGVLHSNGTLSNQASCGPSLNGKTLGELNNNREHLQSHIKEKYYVPSLLVRAIELFPVSQAAKHELSCKWHPDDPNAKSISYWQDIAKDQLKKSLSRYLKRQFGLAA